MAEVTASQSIIGILNKHNDRSPREVTSHHPLWKSYKALWRPLNKIPSPDLGSSRLILWAPPTSRTSPWLAHTVPVTHSVPVTKAKSSPVPPQFLPQGLCTAVLHACSALPWPRCWLPPSQVSVLRPLPRAALSDPHWQLDTGKWGQTSLSESRSHVFVFVFFGLLLVVFLLFTVWNLACWLCHLLAVSHYTLTSKSLQFSVLSSGKGGYNTTLERLIVGSPGTSVVKNPPASAGDVGDSGWIPGLERSPGGVNGNPLQYSCLENPRVTGDWWAIVPMVANSWTWLSTHTKNYHMDKTR